MSLQLTGALVSELREQADMLSNEAGDPRPVASLPHILMRTSQEITAVLNSLYRSRMLLEQTAVPRLQRTHVKLQEVTQATETATHEMLDKLDRASVLIDDIGSRIAAGMRAGDEVGLALHGELREEVHRLVLCLQFHDLVTQQITYATQVLQETERRMTVLASQFKSTVFGSTDAADEADAAWAAHHDPVASNGTPDERQAIADAVFGSAKRG